MQNDFKIINDTIYQKYRGLELNTAYKIERSHWRCETKCEKYLTVRGFGGIIHMF